MKNIPFKTSPRYALIFPKDPMGNNIGDHYPSRHLQQNFAGEQQPGRGLSKDEVYVLEDGITVIHRSAKKKLISKEIKRVFGHSITSTK